jgi:pyroglutamyl-peptidase
MKTILITGFEPFGGDVRNPSAEIATALDGVVFGGWTVVGEVLPCTFGGAARALRRLLRQHRPDAVIGLGLAANRGEVTPERVAINIDDARISDNAGQQPVDRPVIRGAPTAYWSTLPIKAIVRDLRSAKIAASVSQAAGTFVCNHAFFVLMHELHRARRQQGKPTIRAGFIHIPWPADWRPRHEANGRLRFAQLQRAVRLAIVTTVSRRSDARGRCGAIS